MAAATSSSPHFSEASENDDEEQPSPPPMSEATSPHFSDVGVDDDPASPAHFQDRVLEAQTLARPGLAHGIDPDALSGAIDFLAGHLPS